MDYLEKLLFIDLTCKQLSSQSSNHPEYFKTWKILSKSEQEEYAILTNKIHEIWSYINMPKNIDVGIKHVNSVFEYNEIIAPVATKILAICKDFNLSLKRELTDDFKMTVKKIFGNDYLKWLEE